MKSKKKNHTKLVAIDFKSWQNLSPQTAHDTVFGRKVYEGGDLGAVKREPVGIVSR